MIDAGMIAAAAGAVGAVAGSTDSIIKTVKSLKELVAGEKVKDEDVPKLKAALTELLDAALEDKHARFSAYEAEVRLRGQIAELERQLREIDDFDRDAADFELVALVTNSFVYKRKAVPVVPGNTPLYCAPCFDQRRRVILQLVQRATSEDTVECPSCKTQARVPTGRPPHAPAKVFRRTFLPGDRY